MDNNPVKKWKTILSGVFFRFVACGGLQKQIMVWPESGTGFMSDALLDATLDSVGVQCFFPGTRQQMASRSQTAKHWPESWWATSPSTEPLHLLPQQSPLWMQWQNDWCMVHTETRETLSSKINDGFLLSRSRNLLSCLLMGSNMNYYLIIYFFTSRQKLPCC